PRDLDAAVEEVGRRLGDPPSGVEPDGPGVVEEPEGGAGVDRRLAVPARVEPRGALGPEAPLQGGQELQRLWCQDPIAPIDGPADDLDPGRRHGSGPPA